MESIAQPGAAPVRTANESPPGPGAAGARALLRFGMAAGPFYLAVGLVQAFVREGFDFARHPLSLLANGPGGWVQTANFVLTGLMVIAAAAGFKRALGPKSRGVVGCLGGFGLAMIVAAIFPADPVDGFPPGTPEGFPASISTAGLIHFVAGALGFLCLAISCFFAAWAMRRRNRPSLALFSLLGGLVVVVGFFGGIVLPLGVAGIWFAVVVGWLWLAVMSLATRRTLGGGSGRPPSYPFPPSTPSRNRQSSATLPAAQLRAAEVVMP